MTEKDDTNPVEILNSHAMELFNIFKKLDENGIAYHFVAVPIQTNYMDFVAVKTNAEKYSGTICNEIVEFMHSKDNAIKLRDGEK